MRRARWTGAPGAVRRRGCQRFTGEPDKLQGDWMARHAEGNRIQSAGDDGRHSGMAAENDGERTREEVLRQQPVGRRQFGCNLGCLLRSGDVDDERVIRRSAFDGEDAGNGFRIEDTAPSPYTVSVGKATSSPLRRSSAARGSASGSVAGLSSSVFTAPSGAAR